ncbi:MAG: LysR family transcriptional regulator [Acidobacteria bacterium]|nr:LysR family transcriptional regulator [Acidobacteriota bacterium]MBI3656718.1 LysR family transcriptional regulator [Acidobacteriota bacterium]
MNLRQLEMFQAIVDSGSFTKAGEKLYVSQSAISRQIKILEEELGDRLFMRVKKRVVLTPAGEILTKYSNKLFRDLKDTVMAIAETHELARGQLRIGGVMSVCTYLLPRVLARYKALHPRVDLSVITGSSEKITQQILTNQLDLGVLTLPVTQPELQSIPAIHEEMVVVMPTRHPLAKAKYVRVQDLAPYRLILFERGSVSRRVLDKFFEKGQVIPKVAMEIENVEIIKPLVAIGLGITIIPYQSVLDEVRRGKLHYAKFTPRLFRELGLVYMNSDYIPKALQEMITVFQAVIARSRSRFSNPKATRKNV